MDDVLFKEFATKLGLLRDWPDGALIYEITKFTEVHIRLSEFLADILAAKIIDPATVPTFKLPLFYLMDSIMKNVGGPFAALFSRHLVEVFSRSFHEVPLKDQEKLKKLLNTWNERKMLAPQVLQELLVHANSNTNFVGSSVLPNISGQYMSQLFNKQEIAPIQPTSSNGVFFEKPSQSFVETSSIQSLNGIGSSKRPMPLGSGHETSAKRGPGIAASGTQPFRRSADVVDAFMCESHVQINIQRIKDILIRLRLFSNSSSNYISNEFRNNIDPTISQLISMLHPKVSSLVDLVHIPPDLPTALHGKFTPKPSGPLVPLKVNTTVKPSNVRVESDLQQPYRTIDQMYHGQPHQSSEDGVRFRNFVELAKYTDAYLEKKDRMKKKELIGEKVHRSWFCSISQWVSDFNSLKGVPSTNLENAQLHKTVESEKIVSSEVFVVHADEDFVRCPVSKEAFETFWSHKESGFMYRNAVKVLVTQRGDRSLYESSMPTPHPNVRYAIVHKLLVLDNWLKQNRVAPLSKLASRVLDDDFIRIMTLAAGSDNAQTTFALLER